MSGQVYRGALPGVLWEGHSDFGVGLEFVTPLLFGPNCLD
jgi:hypothetical protein